jgi:hypothetical protein
LASRFESGSSIRKTGRAPDDRAPERDALALPAGQLLRLAIEQLLELDRLGGLVDPALDLRLGDLAQLEPEREVLADRHVRVERVALEDHRDVAILGRDVVDDAIADPQRPALISSRPAIIRRLVVLPQPDGPTRTMNSPSPISRLRSFTAWKSPYIFWTLSNVTVAMAQPPLPADLRGPMHPAAEADVDGPRTRTARGQGIVVAPHPRRKA